MMQKELFVYELVEISFELFYDYHHGQNTTFVADDGDSEIVTEKTQFEYDEKGIPKGSSIEEIQLRKKIIFDFYEIWKSEHPEKTVFNTNLKAEILIRKESVVEAAEHSAKRYQSTLAVMRLEEVLSNAVQVGFDKPKPGNKNQAKLVKMLLMEYVCEGIGKIKLTVGIRKGTGDKVQYSITALPKKSENIKPVVSKKKKASQK